MYVEAPEHYNFSEYKKLYRAKTIQKKHHLARYKKLYHAKSIKKYQFWRNIKQHQEDK